MQIDTSHSLELARVEDAEAIATGTARYMHPSQRGLVLASSPEYLSFVKYLLEHPGLEPDRKQFVVKSNGGVVGYIDLRKTKLNPHLNHIWIDASRRGTGLARAALRNALSECTLSGTFDLNVVADNPARTWYENLGMSIEWIDRWYVRPALPYPPIAPLSPHMVAASLAEYGIATAFLPSRDKHVDMLRPDLLKISLGEGVSPGHANEADGIASTFPMFSRVAEHVRVAGDSPPDAGGASLVSVRMSAPIQDVVARLAAG